MATGNDRERRPGAGVAVLVERDQTLLLVQRRHHGLGTWSAPGGYLGHGESLEAAALREVREETGLVLRDLRFLGITNDRFSDGKHNVTVWFAATADDAPLRLDRDELLAAEWFPRDALPEPLYESTARFLKGESLPPNAAAAVIAGGVGFPGQGETPIR